MITTCLGSPRLQREICSKRLRGFDDATVQQFVPTLVDRAVRALLDQQVTPVQDAAALTS